MPGDEGHQTGGTVAVSLWTGGHSWADLAQAGETPGDRVTTASTVLLLSTPPPGPALLLALLAEVVPGEEDHTPAHQATQAVTEPANIQNIWRSSVYTGYKVSNKKGDLSLQLILEVLE